MLEKPIFVVQKRLIYEKTSMRLKIRTEIDKLQSTIDKTSKVIKEEDFDQDENEE